jgi:hypothetical protein
VQTEAKEKGLSPFSLWLVWVLRSNRWVCVEVCVFCKSVASERWHAYVLMMRWWQWQRMFHPTRESEDNMLPLESLAIMKRDEIVSGCHKWSDSIHILAVPNHSLIMYPRSTHLSLMYPSVSAMLRRGVHVSERFLRGPLWSDEYSETYRMRSILHSGYGRDIDCQMRLETETSVDRGLSPFSFWLWNSIPESGGKINCTKSSVSR